MKKRTLLVTGAVFAVLSIPWLALAATGPLDPTKTRIAYPLDVAPVIDGEIDPAAEWALASFRGWMFRVDDTVDDGLLGSELASGDLPTDNEDLSVDVYAGVTEDALYIGVVVIDDDISTDSAASGSENGETWLDDSVEIFIDGDNSNFAERDTSGTNPEIVDTGGQYVITANNAYRHAEAGNPAFGPDAGWFAQTEESATGYHAEFRIPLSLIGNPKRGEFIGFTVAVNDDDGGGPAERQVIWTGLTHVEESYGNLVIGHRQYEGLKALAPTIDGKIDEDEYPGAEVVVINPHTGVYRVGDDDHALDNHAFEWRLTHDEDAIYVAARVTDDNIVADTAEPNSEDGETWVDDSVEIFFDSNESNLQARDQNEMFDGQFVFTTNGAWRDNEANNPEFGEDKDWFAASTVDGNTWDVEFKVLKSALVGGDREDLPMGFNININDDDGAGDRSEQLNWGGSPHSEYTYSELILLSAIPSDPNAVADRNVKFGRLDKNSAQGEETLTIRNAGATETLTLSDPVLSGPDMDAFTIVDFPESILPGETATAVIAFNSQGVTGSFNATLTYTTNDPDPSEAALAAALSASVLNLGGPAARYALDETEGTAMLDRSGYDRHGTYNGATLGQEALVSGTSAMFSGGSYASVPGASLGPFDRFSVAMTVNLADVSESQTLFAKGPENGAPTLALLNSDGTLQWFNDAVPEFGTDDAVLTAGMTHHIAVTWSQASAAIFVDGVAVATQANPEAVDILADDPLVFGSFFGNLDMNGRLDDVQFYDRAISAEDVEFLAANPDDELELDGPIPQPPQFTELWVLGDAANGNQTEFSQEMGMDVAPGSATAQDDDFYFRGIYPDPIGTVAEDEPFVNYDRAHVPGDPFNRIHFNLDADSAAADTELRMTFALCCFGAVDAGPSEHDLVFRLNGKEFFSDSGVNSDRVVQETVTAGEFDVVEGANTIEIERTGGSASAWVQYDYVRLEATAGAPVPAPGGGDPGELPEGAFPLDATATGDGLTAYYWNLPPVTLMTAGEPLHKAGDGAEGADNSNSGWTDENVYNALPNSGQFVATTFNYGGNDLTPIDEWLGDDAGSFSGTEGILGDAAFRFVGYVRVVEPGPRTFTTTSDDGSVVYVNDQLVVSNDNGHGNVTVSGSFDFPAAGYYPVDIRYFNGDWTDEAGAHGGANFIGEAGFTDLVQGLEGVEPFYAPPTDGGGGGDGDRPFVLQAVGLSASGAFNATLPAGVTGDIEYSTDLIDWEVIATGVTGTVEETDPGRLAAPEGYYRATVP